MAEKTRKCIEPGTNWNFFKNEDGVTAKADEIMGAQIQEIRNLMLRQNKMLERIAAVFEPLEKKP